MAFEYGKATLTCSTCGAVHETKWSRMPVRELQTVPCSRCKGVLYQENGLRDHYEVKLVTN